MSSQSDNRPVVIDNGSRTCKAGFSGEQTPKIVVDSLVGTDPQSNDVYVGKDAYQKANSLNLNYPIDHRIINNWDDMTKIWTYIYTNELHTESSSHPVVLTDDPLNTKDNREKMIQIMFETFNVPSFYVANQAVLSLYSAGRLNGIVLDSGETATLATPICSGYYITNTAVQVNIGGREINSILTKLLNDNGHNFTTFSEQEIVRDIKEKHCYLSTDYDTEIQKNATIFDYSLPDGKMIKIGNEVFRSPEILFRPKIFDFQANGIDEIIIEAISKCEEKVRNDLYSNIIVCGGTSKLNNFIERLESEVTKRAPTGMNVKVIEPHRRQIASWIGGSILSSLPTFKDMMVSSQEYNESGSNIVRKCP